MDKGYISSIQNHLNEIEEELSEIETELQTNGYLTKLHYRAAERELQLLIEACIGLAKQTLKTLDKNCPNEAREVFAKLVSLGLADPEVQWSKIVGMRNAIVHDYLNFEPQRIVDVIKTGQYKVLFKFANLLLKSN